jgi:ABC-type multidrug transport system fused ATPase/permease subunit
VNEGAINVDRKDIRDYDLKWLRSNIGLVSQEPVLFSGTISENIRFGNIDATDADVKNAAQLANAHNFIIDLDDGYNTQVGERGIQLSGGQKQRTQSRLFERRLFPGLNCLSCPCRYCYCSRGAERSVDPLTR